MKEDLEVLAVGMMATILRKRLAELENSLGLDGYESMMLVKMAVRSFDPVDGEMSSIRSEQIRDYALRILVTDVVAPQLPINLLKALHKASPGAYQDFKLALYCDSLDPYFCPPQPPL